MQLHFNAISELGHPGPKWQKLFERHWPAYRAWLISKGAARKPDLKTAQAALAYYMPEMMPVYERLCTLADADDMAANFLTGFQPPAYISACSQAVTTVGAVQLVRNYDYHPDLIEGTLLMSAWNGKKVMANSDCLWGVLDGMNEDGLAISLTFGGRKEVGRGFGIPFILRYVLEFCTDVYEAVEALCRIPSHMSYNVTVVDRSGTIRTVHLAPDKPPFVSDAAYTTNHQNKVDWPENAQFNKTIERAAFLKNTLLEDDLDANKLADYFLRPPLYALRFEEGAGTLYTAIYRPVEGSLELRWPNKNIIQYFDDFQENYELIKYQPSSATLLGQDSELAGPGFSEEWVKSNDGNQEVADTHKKKRVFVASRERKKSLNKKQEKMPNHELMSWERIAGYWTHLGKVFWEKWRK